MTDIFEIIDSIIEDQRAIAVAIWLLFMFPLLSLLLGKSDKKKGRKRL